MKVLKFISNYWPWIIIAFFVAVAIVAIPVHSIISTWGKPIQFDKEFLIAFRNYQKTGDPNYIYVLNPNNNPELSTLPLYAQIIFYSLAVVIAITQIFACFLIAFGTYFYLKRFILTLRQKPL